MPIEPELHRPSMPRTIYASAILAFAACTAVLPATAADMEVKTEEAELPQWEENLTGDWDGLRTRLYHKGGDLEIVHVSDVLGNVSGGVENGWAWMGYTGFNLSLDLERLLGWDSTSAYVRFQSGLGSKFNTHYVGSTYGVDNIEVATNTALFTQAWLQREFPETGLSVLAGLYAIDEEFYVTESSGLFLQPALGPGNDLAQAGVNGPPVFPLGALAVRVRYSKPDSDFYVQGALTEGTTADPGNPRRTQMKLGDEGTLGIVEIGHVPQQEGGEGEYFAKTALGVWRYTAHTDDLTAIDSAGNPRQRHSQGIYFLTERTLYAEQDSAQGLAGFFRLGFASKDVHESDWNAGLGLLYRGLIPGREEDLAGVAIAFNHASSKFRRLSGGEDFEAAIEATYQATVLPWLSLQPNLQYIINPGMDPGVKNATILGLRSEILF